VPAVSRSRRTGTRSKLRSIETHEGGGSSGTSELPGRPFPRRPRRGCPIGASKIPRRVLSFRVEIRAFTELSLWHCPCPDERSATRGGTRDGAILRRHA
jgi:hypothetical protein